MVREATPDDLSAINEIENDAIETTHAHFGLEAITIEETRSAFESARGCHPWLVKELEGEIVGFARSSPWKNRGAYRWATEIGVYVRTGHKGQGIGTELYSGLFPLLERLGFHTILAGIALPNDASIRLHERFGMIHAGTLPEVGFKFDAWRSVGYWVKVLDSGAQP